MQRGFPVDLLPLACCSVDGGRLRHKSEGAEAFVVNGEVCCDSCGVTYLVRNGILSLLELRQLHPDSQEEMQVRDARSEAVLHGLRREWRSRFADETEVRPTLEAVGASQGMTICEVGCGPGRYTLALAQKAAAVVAVDLSRTGLLVLKSKLDAKAPVALVQADVTFPYGTQRAFDRMLSTLHSNLPSRGHRSRALRWMSDALRDGGRAVVSMHHYSARDATAGSAASGRYPDSGIYRHFMTQHESQEELANWFGRVQHRFIAARVPGLRSIGVARAVARLPVLREGLSSLMLALAESPVRYQESRSR